MPVSVTGMASGMPNPALGSSDLDDVPIPTADAVHAARGPVYEDECCYWSDAAINAPTAAQRDEARKFIEILSSMRQEFLTFHLLSPFKVYQFVDQFRDMVDDLIFEAFPSDRIPILCAAMMDHVVKFAHDQLPSPLVADNDGLLLLSERAEQALAVVNRALGAAQPSSASSSRGSSAVKASAVAQPTLPVDKGVLVHLRAVAARLAQLVDAVRCLEILRENKVALDCGQLFAQLSRDSLFMPGGAWELAWDQCEYELQAFDDRLVKIVKGILSENESLLLRNWPKYVSLLKRPSGRKALDTQLNVALRQVEHEVRSISSLLKTPPDSAMDRLIWIHQMLERVREHDLLVSRIAADRTIGLSTQLRDLQTTLAHVREQTLAEWIDDVESRRGQLAIGQQLLVLDYHDGRLHVMFPDALGVVFRQARQLLALGCKLPPAIVQLAEEAQRYFKYAVSLRQLAHFYNSIDTKMLSFHKPLLIDRAVQFEGIIQQQIDWRHRDQVARFMATVTAAANDLQESNNRLQALHATFVKTIQGMVLIPTATQWKEGVQKINSTLAGLRWTAEQLWPWRNHLQQQLYKVMQTNYARTLAETNLPEIKIDVVFKNGKVTVRPPIEEVKAKYYRELKRLISQPLTLPSLVEPTGARGAGSAYSDIFDDHVEDMATVYRRAEQTFDELDKKLQTYMDWVVVGCLPADKLLEVVSAQCVTIQDWEAHFKTVKQRGKEAELLPPSFKIDNMTCSILPLKASIDDFLQRLFDVLVVSLSQSIHAHAKCIQECLNSGLELLAKVPTTVSEIAQAKQTHDQLRVNDTQHHFSQIQVKQKLLRTVAGSAPDMSDLVNQYNQFDVMVKGHELMIHDQYDQLQGQIESRTTRLQSQIAQLHAELKDDAAAPDQLLEVLLELETHSKSLVEDCRYFDMPVPSFELLDECHDIITSSLAAQKLMAEFKQSIQPLLETSLVAVQVDDLGSAATTWRERLADQQVSRATLSLHKDIESLLYLAREWHGYFADIKKFTAQHWTEFCALLGIAPTQKVLVAQVLGHLPKLQQIRSQVFDLGLRARNESVVRDAIQDIEIWSISFSLPLTTHSYGGEVALIKEFKGVLVELSDQRAVVSSLLATPTAGAFGELLAFWDTRLADLDQCLHNLQAVQKKWVYLAPVITALPQAQQQKFAQVDVTFRALMRQIGADPRVSQLLTMSQVQQLPDAVKFLELCQRALLAFLEEKRKAFPRFYFIGDEDLLEILSQSALNPLVVQTHLKKLFSGLSSVALEDGRVKGISSSRGEYVPLLAPITITSSVDEWLSALSSGIQETLAALLKECLHAPVGGKAYPEQITDLVYRIQMTARIEQAIRDGTLAAVQASLDSSSYESIYFQRVIKELVAQRVTSTDDFLWLRVLRYYYKDGACLVRCFEAEFAYSFEYQGNPSKLVQTPLTDTCFATLMQAMSEGLGGCLYGPAGTGKTESVKSLGYLLGRQVLVFNCDEALDVSSITRLFCGIVKCGAWGCFDEFNRLSAGVLAAVSNLVSTIQQALLKRFPTVQIAGTELTVNHSSCLFVTLNPAGKQYKGRQQLPNNLKQLFRNIAMTHPDVTYICQIELKAQGFDNTDDLGKVVVEFYDACRKILSVQSHYDWGLRALKAVLMTAGSLRRSAGQGVSGSDVLAEAMRVSTESKLTGPDKQVFLGLLSLYFGSEGNRSTTGDFVRAMADAYKQLGLTPLDWQIQAGFQLHTSCAQRMGVCIVGLPRSGKVTLVKLVAAAWNLQQRPTKVTIVSPKALNRNRLLGFMDGDTREWHDGVVTLSSRNTLAAAETHHLILFDGDVDPEWIEALNSVLDDNRLLTMPNGERIKFEDNVNFIFTTHSLAYASPATVSRMAIVHIDHLIARAEDAASAPSHQLVVGGLGSGRKRRIRESLTDAIWVQATQETTSEHLVSALLQGCTLSSSMAGPTLSTKSGKPLVLVVCDVDLCNVDKYATIQVHQFLHQLIQHRGFYHPKTLEWITVADVSVVCTAANQSLISLRLADKLTVQSFEALGGDAFSRDALAALRSAGIDAKIGSRLAAVMGDMVGKTGALLEAKKWLNLVVARQATDADGVPSFFLRLALVLFPDHDDYVRNMITGELARVDLGIGPLALAAPETRDVRETQALMWFASSFRDALDSTLAVIRISAGQGVPFLAVLTAVCQERSVPVKVLTYTKIASLPNCITQIKDIVLATGVRNSKLVVIVERHACPAPPYYQLIHQLIAGGAPDLVPDMAEAEADFQRAAFPGTMAEFVFQRCLANIKVVLVNMLPALIPGFPLFLSRGMALRWADWDDTCISAITKSISDPLNSAIARFYSLMKHGRAPAQLVAVVKVFHAIIDRISVKLQERRKFLLSGLDKLIAAKAAVDRLSVEAREQQRQLQEKQVQADSYLKQITDTMVNVSNQKAEMEQLTAQLSKEEAVIEEQRQGIQNELARVEPLLLKAKSAVSEIKAEHLTEVRSLRAPPAVVRDVLEGVLRLLGQQDMSWAAMKAVLGKRSFKDDVLNFDAKAVTPAIRAQVEQLMKQKPDSFVEATVRKSSVAAAPLAVWVTANLEYSKVIERVAPLQSKLNQLNLSLDQSRKRIIELNEAVTSVDQTVAKLKTEFAEKTGEAQRLADVLAKTQANLARAQSLLSSLLAEEMRWKQQLATIDDRLLHLEPIAMCCAMYCVWCPPLSETERRNRLGEWTAMLGIEPFSFAHQFEQDLDIPADGDLITRENLIMAALNPGTTFWVADGNGLGLDAIRTYVKPKVISAQNDSYVKELEMAIRLGGTIVLTDLPLNAVHAWLFPILRQEYQLSHGLKLLMLGEKQIEVHDRFRLLVYSPFSGWSVPEDLLGPVQQLCWSTTTEGLSSSLLGIITTYDAPDVIRQLNDLRAQEQQLQAQLAQLELQLLTELSNSTGDILSNDKLYESLMTAKEQGGTVAAALEQSVALQRELKGQQTQYADMLHKTSAMYFLVRRLAKLHPHYRFSLGAFSSWFRAAIEKHPAAGSTDAESSRIAQLTLTMARIVYQHVTVGMDSAHHVAFGLALLEIAGLAARPDLEVLCGLAADSESMGRGNGTVLPSWVPTDRKEALARIVPLVDAKALQANATGWQRWCAGDQEHPPSLGAKIKEALLTQALLPDRLFKALRLATEAELTLPGFDLLHAIQESKVPVLLMVHVGADPIALLGPVLGESALVVSLGQGQADPATEAVQHAMRDGLTVFIQNLQALPEWIPQCISLLHNKGDTAVGFRAILSCEANTITLPAELVEMCTPVNVQAAPGFRRNVMQSLSTLIKKPKAIRDAQVLLLMTWFQCLVQERRYFIPQAWQKYYEFGTGDFASSVRLSDKDLGTIRGLLQLIYGGRVDVPADALKLQLLLAHVFNDEILGTNGRMPSKKLVRGFVIPTSSNLQEMSAAVDSALQDMRDHQLLHLPPNIYATVDAMRTRETIAAAKVLLVQSGEDDAAGSSQAAQASNVTSSAPNSAISILSSLISQLKKIVAAVKPVNEQQLRSSLTQYLGRQLTAMVSQVQAICAQLAEAKAHPDQHRDLLADVTISSTPDEWMSLVPQGNLVQFPREVEKKLGEVAATIGQFESVMKGSTLVGLAPGARVPNVRLCTSSPAGFLCLIQQLCAQAMKRRVHELTLVGALSTSALDAIAADVPDIAAAPVLEVTGLWLQGAVVTDGRLAPVQSALTPALNAASLQATFIPLPSQPVSGPGVAGGASMAVGKARMLPVPVYSDVSRETHVATVAVLVEDGTDTTALVLAGTALILHNY
ncbi:hypothetical protein AMAG_01476 [Allomyces macrogynus ATCC 38327]|uniref:Dynein heavy chain, cytoplasmic n=1 Tax=Allomyces macrogynus (strain ATCC 38327) TaxID=578462 RepID=A0A0L0RZK7_ALLM3|nr:hypothetical protein AMAG_01476 [Allomyces macrogynus ATCC 38327]|eukprot:KNE55585.1 hypothetical protein AMAG_01476 [Allomyces macrogynus ATCC 38327]